MKVNTERFGEIEVSSDNQWVFSAPILGFEGYSRFISIFQDDSPFSVIQSLEDEYLAFVVTNPFLFVMNYEFTLEQRWLELLHIEKEEEVTIRSIVTVRSPSDISINLQAPIVINSRTKEAAQIIIERSEYGTRHPIIENTREGTSYADSIEK